jgi:two-component system cell cycle response regulator DivK
MGSKKKVLIAEDYADIRIMTRIMVEAIGFDVIEASDGAEAIEQAKKNKPDAVLMDIAMPILNGITAATMIHQIDDLANVPIIAVTAYGRDYLKDAGAYGFDAIIQKPVDIDDLKQVLEEKLTADDRRGSSQKQISV